MTKLKPKKQAMSNKKETKDIESLRHVLMFFDFVKTFKTMNSFKELIVFIETG
jgi:hypothetical protein